MSGQPSDKVLHQVFKKLLDFFCGPGQKAILLKRQPDPDFLQLVKDSGSRDWLDLYELSAAELFERMMGELQDFLDVRLPDDPADVQKYHEVLKKGEKVVRELFVFDRKEAEHIALQRRLPSQLSLRCFQIHMICLTRFLTSIQDLIEAAKKGDSEALIKLVKLDLTFLAAPYALKILIEMELADEESFRINLSKALKIDRSFWDLSNARIEVALILGANFGLLNRSYEEIADFLSFHEIDIQPRTLAKRFERLGIDERKPYPKRRKKIDN